MATTAVPAEATAQNDKVLSEALAAASISDKEVEKPEKAEELEEGEIEEEEDDGKPKTVFDSASRFNLKHPLYAPWTLYFDSPQSKLTAKTPQTSIPNASAHGGWLDDMRRVITFDSVEEFWGLYNNIIPPSQLPGKANYYLFKDGIIPAWEDAQNKNGGKWAIQVPRDKTKGQIDQMWLYTVSQRGRGSEREGSGERTRVAWCATHDTQPKWRAGVCIVQLVMGLCAPPPRASKPHRSHSTPTHLNADEQS
jgi:translation initiation factor 4E